MLTSVASSRVRLSRDELHQLRWLLGLALALLACWPLYELETGNNTELLVATALLGSALMFPGWPGRIPAWVHRLAIPATIGLLVMKIYSAGLELLPCLVLVVLVLTLFRSLQYRRRREDWQLILLCLFIIILAGVLTLSMLFAVQILAFTLIAMALLFVMNLLERDSARALERADWRNFHWGAFFRRLYHALDLRLLSLFFGLFAGLVAIGTVIFVAIPRFQFEQAFSITRLRGSAGFTENIEYSAQKDLEQDDSVVLRVDVPNGVAFSTPPYWRMIVFDEYSRNGFHASAWLASKNYEQRAMRLYPRAMRYLNGVTRPEGRWQFFLEPNISEYLPVLGMFKMISFNSTQSAREVIFPRVFRVDSPPTSFLAYSVDDMDLGEAIPMSDGDKGLLDKEQCENVILNKPEHKIAYPFTCLAIPTGDRDYLLKTVAEIRGADTQLSVSEFCTRAVSYLRAKHQTSRSVNVADIAPGKDTLIKWMASDSPGWCEYFAGALTLLTRAAGYPARIAAGYKGATFNTIENYYVIRQTDAHAWVEVFNGVDRWVRVDPTPGDTFIGTTAGGRTVGIANESGWQAWLDSVRMLWYRRVVNFDRSDQEEISETITSWSRETINKIRGWSASTWDHLYEWLTHPFTARHGVGFGVLLAGVAAGWFFRSRLYQMWMWIRGHNVFAQTRSGDPLRHAAGRWLRRFLPAWQAVALELSPAERADWDGVRFDLLALRYGPLDAPPDAASVFRQARVLLRRFAKIRRAQSGKSGAAASFD